MPTISDVAKHAGVSPITVSRVINNSGYISQKTREQVEAAVAKVGYIPNKVARGLRLKRTYTLALIITDITNPFFTTLARGVEDAASGGEYSVIFCNTDESEAKEHKYLHLMLQQQVDGVILVPARSKPDSIRYVQQRQIPIVVVDRRIPGMNTDIVRCDSEEGAYRLVQLLLDLGHRRIAMLNGTEGVSTADDRLLGYQRAMQDSGSKSDTNWVFSGSFTVASGYEMARQALTLIPRPTAVFAANNFIAIGALKALQGQGLRVPEDIAVVGFDDLPLNLALFPFLTVALQPVYEMGQQATRLLLDRLAGTAPEQYQELILPTELIVRQSSGSPLNGKDR